MIGGRRRGDRGDPAEKAVFNWVDETDSAVPHLLLSPASALSLQQRALMTSSGNEEVVDGGEGSEDLHDLFCEIWERESQPELKFAIIGVGSVRCVFATAGLVL